MKRNTWQREAVREALDDTEGFISAQALHSSLHASGSPIGLATVYRALGDLAANGEADSLQSPEGEALYRACTTTGHHQIFVVQLTQQLRDRRGGVCRPTCAGCLSGIGLTELQFFASRFHFL